MIIRVGDSISQWTGTGFNVDSGIEKKSGKDTGVIIESKSERELPIWGSGLLSSLSSISEKDNLPECPGDFNNLEFGQVRMCVLKLNLDSQNDMIQRSNQ